MTTWRMTILKMIATGGSYTSRAIWQWAYDQENEERDNKLVVLPLAFLGLVALFVLLVVIPMMTVDFDYSRIKEAIGTTGKMLSALFAAIVIPFIFIVIQETIVRWSDE